MSERQAVVYTAANSHQAHLLKNLLAEYSVWCAVENDALQGAAEHSASGWTSSPRVVVRVEDFEFAREVAEEFDRTVSERRDEESPEDASSQPRWSHWPACPTCRRPRQTRCPACKMAGTDFPLAEFIAPDDPAKSIRFIADDSEDDDEPVLLICPLCDEAFAPQFYRRCEACGHDYREGLEIHSPPVTHHERLNMRVLFVLGGLIAAVVGLLAYWSLLVLR